jgi:hypothetical protein
MNEAENLKKQLNFPLYEKDYEILDKSQAHYRIVFDAVDHLEKTRELFKEIKLRRLEYADYLRENIGKQNIPFSEENFSIVIEEVSLLRD